jgi:hypothetical protein
MNSSFFLGYENNPKPAIYSIFLLVFSLVFIFILASLNFVIYFLFENKKTLITANNVFLLAFTLILIFLILPRLLIF